MAEAKVFPVTIPRIPYCRVYISESDAYPGYFLVSILYPQNGTYTLRQNLHRSEADAIKWAEGWLGHKYFGVAKLGTPEGAPSPVVSSWTPGS